MVTPPFNPKYLALVCRAIVNVPLVHIIAEFNQLFTGNVSDSYALAQRFNSNQQHLSV